MKKYTLYHWFKNTIRAITIALMGAVCAVHIAHAEKLPKKVSDYDPKKIVSVITGVHEKWMENYNPFSESQLPTVRDFMFEPMVVFEKQNLAKPHFRLAESFKYNRNNLQVIFHLRPNLKWSDGFVLTAHDVVFTFETLKKYRGMDTGNLWDTIIEDVALLNSHKVIFNLKVPNNTAHIKIGQIPILPKHIWGGLPRLDLYRNIQHVGSGPLTEIVDYKPSRYYQCANPHYWDKKSLNIDCLRVNKFISTQLAYEAVELKNDIDWFALPYNDIERELISKDPQKCGYALYDKDTVGIMLNYKTKKKGNAMAFNSPSFKKAVAMAVNREHVTAIATYKKTIPIETSTALPRSFAKWRTGNFARDDLAGAYDNIIKIRQLLTEGGFSDINGDGWVDTIQGDPIHMDIVLPAGNQLVKNTADLLAYSLQKVGIHTNVRFLVQSTYTDTIKSGEYQATLVNWNHGTVPMDFYIKFYSEQSNPDYKLASGYNNYDYDDALAYYFESPWGQGSGGMGESQEKLTAIMQHFTKNMPVIPLYSHVLWHQFKTHRFTGWYKESTEIRGSLQPENPERLLQLLNLKPVK